MSAPQGPPVDPTFPGPCCRFALFYARVTLRSRPRCPRFLAVRRRAGTLVMSVAARMAAHCHTAVAPQERPAGVPTPAAPVLPAAALNRAARSMAATLGTQREEAVARLQPQAAAPTPPEEVAATAPATMAESAGKIRAEAPRLGVPVATTLAARVPRAASTRVAQLREPVVLRAAPREARPAVAPADRRWVGAQAQVAARCQTLPSFQIRPGRAA